ncbi:hypothetical protein INT47_005489 [Mucor saturninus]|uniref:Uncharacterized protein n=1 Tax=Mucor saturninus TaxID=64648 RepID=A0A8H7V889_9FUNG|nr:hypothetical protein INT47_005489 [Mucor saturninus]
MILKKIRLKPANDTVDEHNIPFEDMFKKLNQNSKWYLSTGKCVDDELFMFGLKCESDHSSRPLIIDPYDKNNTSYNVFTEVELQGIINQDIEAVGGESACLGTKKRKNNTITIGSISKISRSKYGHKCDLIFRQFNNKHTAPLEFGASEAKSKIEDESGTNFMNEGFYKLPRVLKDMLDSLLKEINFDHRSEAIRTVGFIHSGLSSTLIELNRPTKYISRVSR